MHVKSGEKLILPVIFQDFDGNAKEPTSYSVELWRINVSTGEMEEVEPTLIDDAEDNITGAHYYEYTTPSSGHYVYDWRYYTSDENVLAMELREMHESGGWVDDVAQDSDISSLINMLTNSAVDLVGNTEELTAWLYAAFDETITCNVSLDDADEIVFSLKAHTNNTDDEALIRVHSVNGLERLNGAAAESSDGSIAGSGYNATLAIADHAMATLSAKKGCAWDIKKKVSGDWIYVKSGHVDIKAHATRSVS